MPTKKTTTPATTKASKAKKPATRKAAGKAANGAKAASGRSRVNRIHDLVIVESPAKARTLAGMLGPGYEITASVGHVRDLPKSKLGVDVDNEFLPQYIVPREKKEVVNKIKEMATTAN